MATKSQFKDFLSDIEPSPTTKKDASKGHTSLRDSISSHAEFSSVHIDTFLSGSYRRDTAIRPRTVNGEQQRPDVDIIVVTNRSLQDDPASILSLLHKSLKDKYANTRLQARSVGVTTSKVDMDVVPIIAPSGIDGTLYIPDRKLSEWLETNPPKHTTWTTQINKARGGYFKPLVKLFKWWRRENPTISNKPKGFMIECILAECMPFDETNYATLFLDTCQGILNKYRFHILLKTVPSISDPAVPTNNVLSNVTFPAFEGFYNKVQWTLDKGTQAQQETDPEKALKLWREIFGGRFPAPASLSSKNLLGETVQVPYLEFPDKPIRDDKPRGFA